MPATNRQKGGDTTHKVRAICQVVDGVEPKPKLALDKNGWVGIKKIGPGTGAPRVESLDGSNLALPWCPTHKDYVASPSSPEAQMPHTGSTRNDTRQCGLPMQTVKWLYLGHATVSLCQRRIVVHQEAFSAPRPPPFMHCPAHPQSGTSLLTKVKNGFPLLPALPFTEHRW